MSAPAFEFVADELERRTDLARLEARGTVRLALRQAGLDAGSVTAAQMAVILERVLPGEMGSRGISDAESVCQAVTSALLSAQGPGEEDARESPEAIFRRLADR